MFPVRMTPNGEQLQIDIEENDVAEEEKNKEVQPIDINEEDEKQSEDRQVQIEEENEAHEEEGKEVQEEVKKKKIFPVTFQQFTVSRKMKIVQAWKKEKNISKQKWCRDQNINVRSLRRWIKKYPKWKKLSNSEKKRTKTNYIQKGMYHAQEIQLNKRFTERRAEGHRFTGRWLKTTMKQIVRVDLPGFDTHKKFKSCWLNKFCRRFRITGTFHLGYPTL